MQNLKNPKVGKAEILESVVHFLKTEKDMKGQKGSKLQPPAGSRQQAYDEGRRSCLMRISHFISSKSKDVMAAAEESAVQPSLALPQPQRHSGRVCAAQVRTPVCDSPLSRQHWLQQQQHAVAHPHPHLTVGHTRCDTQELFSPLTNISEPVWRPWPQ